MDKQTENDSMKFGVNWSYLKTLLDIYEKMFEHQHILITAISSNRGINPQLAYCDLLASVYSFFVSVESQYVKSKNSLKKEEFINLMDQMNNTKLRDPKKLISLSRNLVLWATSEGVFKTLTETTDINQKW